MDRILISACLLGEPVRYDGRDNLLADPRLRRWQEEGRLVPICPEMAGGLPTPRPAAEVEAGDGVGVWRGQRRVLAREGEDVTDAFRAGAQAALALAREAGCRLAILTEKSPSCGSHHNYDGRFQRQLVAGEGVTAALLRSEGLAVFSQHELDAVEAFLHQHEARVHD